MDEMMFSARQRGFTLIEMMLAIAIFALLSLMAAQILRSMLLSHERIQLKTDGMVQLQQVMALMERDLSQATLRPAADESTPNLRDFSVVKGTNDELELVRHHWANPGALLARSSLERVRYRIREGQLQRLSYPVPDAKISQARIVPVMQGVNHFQLRFWQSGTWVTGWYASSLLPQAIEVTLDHVRFGHLRHIILLGKETS